MNTGNLPSSVVHAFSGFAKTCYEASMRGGWHADLATGQLRTLEQNYEMLGTRISLTHSELSEGMEGHRKRLNDDKLPDRPMAEVELADACIRIFDLCGCMNWAIMNDLAFIRTEGWPPLEYKDFPNYLAHVHSQVSMAFEFAIQGLSDRATSCLARAVVMCYELCNGMGWNLIDAMNEKMVFNENRPDHKAEARKASGGKQY